MDTSKSESKWDPAKFDSMNIPRGEHTCAEHNGTIFVIGGKDSESKVLNSVEVLDMLSENRKWENGPPLPENFEVHGCNLLKYEYDLYLICGDGTVLLLDSNGAQWTHKKNASTEHKTWNFLPAAKMKAGNCLKGEIFKDFLILFSKQK